MSLISCALAVFASLNSGLSLVLGSSVKNSSTSNCISVLLSTVVEISDKFMSLLVSAIK